MVSASSMVDFGRLRLQWPTGMEVSWRIRNTVISVYGGQSINGFQIQTFR